LEGVENERNGTVRRDAGGQTMPLILIAFALVLHFLLGWPLWLSVLVSGGGQTTVAIAGNLLLRIPLLAPIWKIFAGGILGMLTFYVPTILVLYLIGHPTW
jgi:hypothetical protein